MYAHERSLVKRMDGRPFTLLGVNSDENLERLKKRVDEEKLSWRSWRNGGSKSGPISSKWNVTAWPTTYVLDHRGVIRVKNKRGEALDAAIDLLVAEAEADR
jgi:hypothetical protein